MQRRLIVDVTQYAHWPATSGIQRVLLHLARDWPGDEIDARFGVLDKGSYATGPLSALGVVIASAFRAGGTGVSESSDFVLDSVRNATDAIVDPLDLDRVFDGYLLPEPTLRADNLDIATQLGAREHIPTFFIYFDALPLTHPQLYPRDADSQGLVGRYNRAVARSENVAFISTTMKTLFERRIARRPLGNAIVARPGADSLAPTGATQPERPTFTVLGTVEPRKRHRLVLEAFEQLWSAGRDYRLIILGAPGWEKADFLDRLRHLTYTGRVDWIEAAGDREIADVLARSSAVVFAPFAEGYGLPPLEALAAGCPAIVSADLPALENLPSNGQIRLSPVTREAVASAVETLANREANEAARRAIGDLELPTWRQFAVQIEQWVALEMQQAEGANDVSR